MFKYNYPRNSRNRYFKVKWEPGVSHQTIRISYLLPKKVEQSSKRWIPDTQLGRDGNWCLKVFTNLFHLFSPQYISVSSNIMRNLFEFFCPQNWQKKAFHNWLWRVWNYGKNIRSFLYKNLLFHRGKQDPKWSSGVLYCSLLLIWWKDRKLSKKNNEIVSLRSNPQDKEHFCLPNTKTGLKPCGFASRKVVWQKSITSLFWCLEYFIS